MFKHVSTLPLAALVLVAVPAAVQAQNYSDLPPLTPMGQNQLRDLPADMRSAPVMAAPAMAGQASETVTTVNGIETITRTRRIDAPRPLPAAPAPHAYAPPMAYAPQAYPAYAPPMAYGPAPAVFEREQWIDECRRRTRWQSRDNTGLIIGGLLGAIAGGVAGYEIAGVGDRVLGTALGVGGGGLVGGLIGSLFGGSRRKNLYDCEAALDSYLSAYGAPGARIASRTIPYPAYDYGYGYQQSYIYAPPPQMVVVPVRTEVQQQVVVRETERYESYSVPGSSRVITEQRPSPKMIKMRRR